MAVRDVIKVGQIVIKLKNKAENIRNSENQKSASKITKVEYKNSEMNISYSLIPYQRNQDVIKIQKNNRGAKLIVSVVDGYNDNNKLRDNKPGKNVATFVATNFPKTFLKTQIKDVRKRAEISAEIIDQEVIKIYPAYVACVGGFLFSFESKQIIIVVGSIFVYIWNGFLWKKAKEIGDYSLDLKKYPSDVSRFFGEGELKRQNPTFYKAKPDTVILPYKTPVFIGTDGTEEILSLEDLNHVTKKTGLKSAKKLIDKLTDFIQSKKNLQNDDASIFLKI